MNLIQITPGAGTNFYCENCLRDASLVRELVRRGHRALMVPLYLPPVAEGPGPPDDVPIFFGGINVYLQQTSALFRHTPRWLDRVLDARPLLRSLSVLSVPARGGPAFGLYVLEAAGPAARPC